MHYLYHTFQYVLPISVQYYQLNQYSGYARIHKGVINRRISCVVKHSHTTLYCRNTSQNYMGEIVVRCNGTGHLPQGSWKGKKTKNITVHTGFYQPQWIIPSIDRHTCFRTEDFQIEGCSIDILKCVSDGLNYNIDRHTCFQNRGLLIEVVDDRYNMCDDVLNCTRILKTMVYTVNVFS